MKLSHNLFYSITFSLLMLIVSKFEAVGQVAIGATSVSDGAALDVVSTDKGVLFPTVVLTSTILQGPVTGALTPGTLVYNSNTSPAGPTQVNPGHYYWDGGKWKRMSIDPYTLQFEQTATVIGNGTNNRIITGLDQTIAIPFSGTYQIQVVMNYNSRFPGVSTNTGSMHSGLANIRLYQVTGGGAFDIIAENMISSVSPDALQTLPQKTIIIKNVELIAGTSYRFLVTGREWDFSNGYSFGGEFGGPSQLYDGALGDPDFPPADALFGTMNITLINAK